jgi:hypothetical protein
MKTGTKIAIGVVTAAAVGGLGYYLWKKRSDEPTYQGESLRRGSRTHFRRIAEYAATIPTGFRRTSLGLL